MTTTRQESGILLLLDRVEYKVLLAQAFRNRVGYVTRTIEAHLKCDMDN